MLDTNPVEASATPPISFLFGSLLTRISQNISWVFDIHVRTALSEAAVEEVYVYSITLEGLVSDGVPQQEAIAIASHVCEVDPAEMLEWATTLATSYAESVGEYPQTARDYFQPAHELWA